jgi:hypothetical protein
MQFHEKLRVFVAEITTTVTLPLKSCLPTANYLLVALLLPNLRKDPLSPKISLHKLVLKILLILSKIATGV